MKEGAGAELSWDLVKPQCRTQIEVYTGAQHRAWIQETSCV